MTRVFVSGSFDDLRSRQIRFLEEASQFGRPLHVLLWGDALARSLTSQGPKFPETERKYLVEAIRWVDKVTLVNELPDPDSLPLDGLIQPGDAWVVEAGQDTPRKRKFCQDRSLQYHALADREMQGFPDNPPDDREGGPSRKKVVVTGCYDWLHSGHIRFFEEVSALGDLYVVVGSDENVALLKGPGHPLFSQAERRYVVQAVRYVKQALISTGNGWMDAEPEIDMLKPDVYAVNEDGDKPEKREFCVTHGLEYVVLQRAPKDGLPRRESTILRGF